MKITLDQILVIIGFLLILANAIDYIFGLSKVHNSMFLFGLIFSAVGLTMAKKGK